MQIKKYVSIYRGKYNIPLYIEEKIAISILEEEIEMGWSKCCSIIEIKGNYRGGLEMLLRK